MLFREVGHFLVGEFREIGLAAVRVHDVMRERAGRRLERVEAGALRFQILDHAALAFLHDLDFHRLAAGRGEHGILVDVSGREEGDERLADFEVARRIDIRREVNREALEQREIKRAHRQIAPVGVDRRAANDHATIAVFLFDEERIAAVEPREHRRVADGGRRILRLLHFEPQLHRRVVERAVARIVEKFEREIFKALGDDADRRRVVARLTGECAEREWQQALAVLEQRCIPPRGIDAIAREQQQPAAGPHEILDGAELFVAELAHVREHRDGDVAERLRVQRIGGDDLVLNEVRVLDFRGAERLQRDLREIRFAFQRLRARIAVDEQQRHLVAHGDAREKRVVGLERVGLGGDLDHVRARRVEGVGEKHLPFLMRVEFELRHALVLAVHFEKHAQVRPIGVAEIADVRANLDLLADPDHKSREVERLDRDVVLHLRAHIEKRDRRRRRLLLQTREHFAEHLVFLRGKTHALEIREHHDLADGFVHLPKRVAGKIERRRDGRRTERGIGFIERLDEPARLVGRHVEQPRTALPHQHDRRLGSILQVRDDARRLVACERPVRRAGTARIHRVAVVEQHDRRGLGIAEQFGSAFPNRSRHREREEQRNRAADREENPLLDADAALVLADHRLEQMHRAPLHDLEAALVEEVDDDRDREGEDTGEQRGVEEGHARGLRFLRAVL